jgi:hypothetical protein
VTESPKKPAQMKVMDLILAGNPEGIARLSGDTKRNLTNSGTRPVTVCVKKRQKVEGKRCGGNRF